MPGEVSYRLLVVEDQGLSKEGIRDVLAADRRLSLDGEPYLELDYLAANRDDAIQYLELEKSLPDAIIPSVRQAARSNYEYLLDPGREAVLRRLRQPAGSDAETPAQWSQVGTWLAGRLVEWSVFACSSGIATAMCESTETGL